MKNKPFESILNYLKDQNMIGKEEFDYLKYVYVNKKYRTNNRELQRVNNRKVYYYRNKK